MAGTSLWTGLDKSDHDGEGGRFLFHGRCRTYKRPAIAPAIFVIDTGALGDAAFYVGLKGGVAPDGLRRRPRNIRMAVAALGPALTAGRE